LTQYKFKMKLKSYDSLIFVLVSLNKKAKNIFFAFTRIFYRISLIYCQPTKNMLQHIYIREN